MASCAIVDHTDHTDHTVSVNVEISQNRIAALCKVKKVVKKIFPISFKEKL